jgi:hypothetical protein
MMPIEVQVKMTDMRHIDQIIAGLQIVAKYPNSDHDVCSDHDIIWAGTMDMTDEDKHAMMAAGWHWDNQSDSFAHFT